MRRQRQKDVQEPLMLVMPVKPGRTDELKAALNMLAAPGPAKALEDKLDKVGTVHSTRFVVLEDGDRASAKLIVLALFDGSVRDYIAAFARELDDQFNLLFRFVVYVENRDVKPANGQTYSAYPGLTALDLYEATRPPNDGAPTQ